MVYTLVGYKETSFTPKDSKDVIKGFTLFFEYPLEKSGEGLGVEKLFLSVAKADRCQFVPSVGSDYTIYFNRFGKLDFIELR